MFYLILIFSQMVHSYTVDFGHEILRMGFCAVRQQKRDLDKSLFVFISSFLFRIFFALRLYQLQVLKIVYFHCIFYF